MPLLLGTTGRITLLDLSGGNRNPDLITSRFTGLKLKLIPAGEFLMGTTPAQVAENLRQLRDAMKEFFDDEQPQHRVRIARPFYLGLTEVTVGQFRQVVESSGYRTEAERDGKGGWGWNEAKKTTEQDPRYSWRNPGFPQSDDHPVTNVSWNDAIAFCNALSERDGLTPYYRFGAGQTSGGDGYRLPTEAEWEYACRARTTSRYQSGDDHETLATVGNICDGTARAKYPNWTWAIAARDGYVFTAPVGRFTPNGFGLYDMHGNVWEWCWDGYKADYYKEAPLDNPQGPSSASDRVLRGGSWNDVPQNARSANRHGFTPDDRLLSLGFRLSRGLLGIK
jgi:formylglycine-generating enzyme required for sulfatase activity